MRRELSLPSPTVLLGVFTSGDDSDYQRLEKALERASTRLRSAFKIVQKLHSLFMVSLTLAMLTILAMWISSALDAHWLSSWLSSWLLWILVSAVWLLWILNTILWTVRLRRVANFCLQAGVPESAVKELLTSVNNIASPHVPAFNLLLQKNLR